MDFSFSKNEEMLRRAVHDFGQKELTNRELDALDHIPADIIKKLGELGFLGLGLPKAYGGVDATWLELGILIEEIAKFNASLAYQVLLTYDVNLCLAGYGKDEVKAEAIANLVRGDTIGSIAMTEQGCGSDVSALKTIAIRKNDDYLINGRKGPVSFARQADFTILFAKTQPHTSTGEISAFWVPLDHPRISLVAMQDMGLSPAASAQLSFDGVDIPLQNRLGEEGDGFKINKSAGLFSDLSRILAGLICLGMAQRSLDMATSYACKRVAFGRPIVQFQAISHKIAVASTLVEAARWLCYRALWLKDKRLPNHSESAMCGWWCPKIAFQIIENALLVYGHFGYSNDYPLECMLRDVVAFEIIFGTEQNLKTTITRQVIGPKAIPESLTDLMNRSLFD
jgi:cyclohexanecarboxyl-CoA dehydrogenase